MGKLYVPIINRLSKLFSYCSDMILKIGQMQLLRTKIGYELNNAARFDSKQLLHALSTFNQALMSEVNAHFEDPSNPYPDEENPLVYELNPYLECIGLFEPLKKIYVATKRTDYMPFFASLFILAQIPKLQSIKLTGWGNLIIEIQNVFIMIDWLISLCF